MSGECWCGAAARGPVGDGEVQAHDCRECSDEHCILVANARRCEFGLCTREAELELTLAETMKPVQVCGLHVAPVLGWGVPEPLEPPRIRYLVQQSLPPAAA